VNKLREIDPGVEISILTVDIEPETKYSSYMDQFSHVYTFDE